MYAKMNIRVVGTSFVAGKGRLWHIYKNDRQTKLYLVREPENPASDRAIAVYAKVGKVRFKVGYVPANVAKWLSYSMDNGRKAFLYRMRKDGVEQPWVAGREYLGVRAELAYEMADKTLTTNTAVELDTETEA